MRASKRMRSAAKFTGAFVLGTPDAGNRRWGTSVDGVGVVEKKRVRILK